MKVLSGKTPREQSEMYRSTTAQTNKTIRRCFVLVNHKTLSDDDDVFDLVKSGSLGFTINEQLEFSFQKGHRIEF